MKTSVVDLVANNIHLEILGERVLRAKIPYEHVPYTFAPRIEEHHVLTGDNLMNGMLVVLEDRVFRTNPDILSPEYPARKTGFLPTSYDRAKVEETSRWCIVTNLRQYGSNQVAFDGIYADGTVRSRKYSKLVTWAAFKAFEVETACESCGLDHKELYDEEAKEDVSDIEKILSNTFEAALGNPSEDRYAELVNETSAIISKFFGIRSDDEQKDSFFADTFNSRDVKAEQDAAYSTYEFNITVNNPKGDPGINASEDHDLAFKSNITFEDAQKKVQDIADKGERDLAELRERLRRPEDDKEETTENDENEEEIPEFVHPNPFSRFSRYGINSNYGRYSRPITMRVNQLKVDDIIQISGYDAKVIQTVHVSNEKYWVSFNPLAEDSDVKGVLELPGQTLIEAIRPVK